MSRLTKPEINPSKIRIHMLNSVIPICTKAINNHRNIHNAEEKMKTINELSSERKKTKKEVL